MRCECTVCRTQARRQRSVRRRQRGDLGHRRCDMREERKFELDEATCKRSAKPLASRRTLDFLFRRLLRRRQEQGALQPSL